jgi:hypothetical protein
VGARAVQTLLLPLLPRPQGCLGTCWLAAAITAVTSANPAQVFRARPLMQAWSQAATPPGPSRDSLWRSRSPSAETEASAAQVLAAVDEVPLSPVGAYCAVQYSARTYAAHLSHTTPHVIVIVPTHPPPHCTVVGALCPPAQVRLFLGGVWRVITVDGFVPASTCTGAAAFAASRRRQAWGLILEKACAEAYGSYGALHGGYTSEALRMLTGTPVYTLSTRNGRVGLAQGPQLHIAAPDPERCNGSLRGGSPIRRRHRLGVLSVICIRRCR